jgi:pyrroloquinoline-quinone synthase
MTSTQIDQTQTDIFVEALRSQSKSYHDQHPFHIRMNDGRLSRRQIQGWVANRFYYQENIPPQGRRDPQ